jgi:hypothetical protein
MISNPHWMIFFGNLKDHVSREGRCAIKTVKPPVTAYANTCSNHNGNDC